MGVFLWVWCVWGGGYRCLYGWSVRRVGTWEGGRRETTLLFIWYIKFISSWKKFYTINLIKCLKLKTEIASVQNMKSFMTIKISFYRTLHLFSSWDDLKRAEEGASHTLLTVRFIILTPFAPTYPNSAALLMPFDRQVIDFWAFVLLTQTYKRLLKLKW